MGKYLPVLYLHIKRSITAIALILGLLGSAYAQQRSLGISGIVKEDRKNLSGVKVSIYKGSSRVEQFSTDGSGRFDYPLDVNSLYIVEISKSGYVSKKLSFNTTVPDEENVNWTFDFVVDLFKVPDGMDLAVFKNPVAKIQYNDQYDDFDYDLDYSMEFQKKEEEAMRQAEEAIKSNQNQAAAQAAEEKRQQELAAKEAASKQAEIDKQYKDAVAEGDREFKAGNMDAAFNAYIRASEIKPEEKYPNERIDEVNKRMEEKRKTDIKYYSTIEKGDDVLKEGLFEQAIVHYKEAAGIRKENKEALDKIKEAEAKMAEAKKLEEEYQKQLAEADKLFKEEKFAEAKAGYEKAAALKPEEEYPAQQIKVAGARIESAKKKEAYYAAAIEKGDKALAAANYDEAMEAYKEAQALKPKEKYPKTQVDAVGKLQAEARKKDEEYAKYIQDGDNALKAQSYAEAKGAYEQALKVKKDSEEALKKLQDVEMKLAAIKQQEDEYKAAIEKADDALKAENYGEAKAGYEKASGIKPEEKYPKDQITIVEAKIAEAKKREELEKAYAEAIASADKAFQAESYEEAKGHYEAAQKAKPEEKYPGEQLSKIDKLVKEAQKVEEEYKQAMADGDKAFKSEQYAEAKSAYEKALGIKKDDATALEKLQETEAKIAALAQAEKEYKDAVSSADDALKAENYAEAKAGYEKASGIKPEEKYPKDQIAVVEAKIAEAKKKEEQEKAYAEAIASADKAFQAESYDEAKGHYEAAQKAKPDEKYPGEQLSKIEKLVKEAQKVEEEYNQAMADGDKAFKSEKYAEAKSAYEKALGIKKDDANALEKLQETEAKIAALAQEEKEYADAISNADKAFKAADYENAKAGYEKASGIKPDEKYPKEQIAAIATKMAEAKAKEELEKKYADAIALGDKEFESENYQAAIKAYKDAIDAKPDEKYPSQQIDKIGDIIEGKKKVEDQYADAMATGEKAFKVEKYADAKSAFEKALGIKKDDEKALKKLEEVEAKLAMLAMNEKDYQEAIAKADNAFKAAEYATAKAGYEKALSIRSDEKYPKEQLKAIEEKFAELKEQEKQEKAYADAIAKGDGEFKANNYDAAIAAYEKALDIKPKEKHPADQIAKINDILKDSKKAEAEFAKAMERGNKAFKDEKYADAKSAYEQALNLKKDSEEALKKLQEVEAKIAAIAQKEQEYQELIAKADKAFGDQDYKSAKDSYEKALGQKPDDKHPKERIAEIEDILAKKGEVEKEYQAAIKEGDAAFGKKDWEKAITAYEDALKIKPDESYPKGKIEEINNIKAQKLEKNNAYENAIAAGDASFKAKNYEDAKASYNEALALKPNEKYPAERIKEIDGILEKQQDKEKDYKELIAKADATFGGANWKSAIEQYNKALEVKPEEQYPKDKIKEAENNMKADKDKVAEYEAVIAKADKAFKASNFTAAREAYTSALSIRPNEQYPKDQLAEIDRVYAQLKAAAKKKELADAERVAREEAARQEAEEQARKQAEIQKKKEEAIAAAKEQAREKAEEHAQLVEEKKEILAEMEDLEEQRRADEMQKDAEKLLEEEIAREEARIRAEAERKIREELEAKLTDERTQLEEEQALQRAQEAQEQRKAELEARKQAEEEAFVAAQEKAKAIAEQEKLEREQREAERKAKEEAIAQAAKEKAAQEEEMRKKVEEEIRIAREQKQQEERARAQAELEARKQAEKEAFEKAQAEAQARLEAERKAKQEREEAERAAREAKIEEAKRKAEEERIAREEEEIKRKAEAVALAEAAKAKREAEEQARLDEEKRRKEYVEKRAEEVKSKEEFEKTAKEIAMQTAQESKNDIYDEVRQKLESEYEDDFAKLEKQREEGSKTEKKEEKSEFSSFKNELAKKYPVGITEETMSESNKKITKLVVNRNGNANEYQKVKWNWGGVYYFKNGESISKSIYDTETQW